MQRGVLYMVKRESEVSRVVGIVRGKGDTKGEGEVMEWGVSWSQSVWNGALRV